MYRTDVLQAGVTQAIDKDGSYYFAWYEWFAQGDDKPSQPLKGFRPGYMQPVSVCNFPVKAGDEVLCLVFYIPLPLGENLVLKAGYIVFQNQTTGRVFAVWLLPPSNAYASGASIEWILERPGIGNTGELSTLPHFDPVTFDLAAGTDGVAGDGIPQPGDALNIVDNTQAPPQQTTATVEPGSIPNSASITIVYNVM